MINYFKVFRSLIHTRCNFPRPKLSPLCPNNFIKQCKYIESENKLFDLSNEKKHNDPYDQWEPGDLKNLEIDGEQNTEIHVFDEPSRLVI